MNEADFCRRSWWKCWELRKVWISGSTYGKHRACVGCAIWKLTRSNQFRHVPCAISRCIMHASLMMNRQLLSQCVGHVHPIQIQIGLVWDCRTTGDTEWGPRREEPEGAPFKLPSLDVSGVVPCPTHGMDHLTRDPSCEFCKKALGPLYRHLKGKYGSRLEDQTPTLSFDFSGPFRVSATGSRYMLLFVWRLSDVRLLWAFALDRRTKENVRSCLQDVVAGSKPPVMRVHSDQAGEFLSPVVMEWLKQHNIRQTFKSGYDPAANGVAE